MLHSLNIVIASFCDLIITIYLENLNQAEGSVWNLRRSWLSTDKNCSVLSLIATIDCNCIISL